MYFCFFRHEPTTIRREIFDYSDVVRRPSLILVRGIFDIYRPEYSSTGLEPKCVSIGGGFERNYRPRIDD